SSQCFQIEVLCLFGSDSNELDRSACKLSRRFIFFANSISTIIPYAKTIASEGEPPDLCPHWSFSNHGFIYIKSGSANRFAVWSCTFPCKFHTQGIPAWGKLS